MNFNALIVVAAIVVVVALIVPNLAHRNGLFELSYLVTHPDERHLVVCFGEGLANLREAIASLAHPDPSKPHPTPTPIAGCEDSLVNQSRSQLPPTWRHGV